MDHIIELAVFFKSVLLFLLKFLHDEPPTLIFAKVPTLPYTMYVYAMGKIKYL
jgi:hypothetical protein